MNAQDALKYSFNQDALANAPKLTKITLQKAYYLLVNVEEHPEILPLAFDIVSRNFDEQRADRLGIHKAPADHVDWKGQVTALAKSISEIGTDFTYSIEGLPSDQSRRQIMHFYRHYMPMALVDGCWLQTGARVSTAHTRIGAIITGLYQHQVRAFVADPGRHFVNDYKAAFSRIAGTIEDVSTRSFSERSEFASECFQLPVVMLSVAQFARTRAPEIIGANLAWNFLRIPSFGLQLISDFCNAFDLPKLDGGLNEPEYLQRGVNMAFGAAEALMEETEPAQEAEVWARLVAGAETAFRLWEEWFSATTQSAPSGPPDPRQEMINLMWRKAAHARGYHGKRPLGDRLIDDFLNTEKFDGPKLLNALANSPWVRPGQPDKSPLLNRLLGFGGPMLGVFNPLEQQTIREWINSLPPREGRNMPAGGVKAELAGSEPEMKPEVRATKTVEGRVWQANDIRQRSKAIFGNCSVRELYHHLVNVEFYPEILPVAEQFARDRLERSMASIWKGERPIPSRRYDPAALDRWVEEKHRSQVDSYRQPSERPEVPKDAFIEATVQLAPLILIDGGWLQGMASPAIIHTTVGRMLFHVFVEEIGEGNALEHHANIYRDLLHAMGISAPSIASREFIEWDRLDAESFEVPALWLAISCFPRHFMPEILGLNLAVELAGVGAPYMEARDTLRKFRYPTLFVDVHNAADNVTAGHSAWAVNAIKRYLDELAERNGPHHLDETWHRVWSGVRLTLPQIGRIKLFGHRMKRRFLAADERFVPLIFPT
ncbi:iron-containing redox enzyme family protein [Mesorhizobium sp. KR9-304]|uniref:iron-containing redox enzyme family protein n=1 Tax=Mesorhizobium sp. KR9-304 TaxID=3156614 RepID=UPI0032B4A502